MRLAHGLRMVSKVLSPRRPRRWRRPTRRSAGIVETRRLRLARETRSGSFGTRRRRRRFFRPRPRRRCTACCLSCTSPRRRCGVGRSTRSASTSGRFQTRSGATIRVRRRPPRRRLAVATQPRASPARSALYLASDSAWRTPPMKPRRVTSSTRTRRSRTRSGGGRGRRRRYLRRRIPR